MYINSSNEWDSLKTVVVGTATNANWPAHCKDFQKMWANSSWTETEPPVGPVNESIKTSANSGLEYLCRVLMDLGINVLRPTDLDFESFDGFYNYCPRDRLLVIDDVVVNVPMAYGCRAIEILAYDFVGKTVSVDNPHACFDAANVCRLGDDLLYLVSESGNVAGAEWLQYWFPHKRVHVLDNIYRGVHIDSTISPVREGLVVLNGDRINKDNIPKPLRDWDIIWMYSNDLAHQNFEHYPYASNYIGLNFLTVDPNTVICDPKQKVLQERLAAFGVNTIGVALDQSRTLGGGHHCVTLDLVRSDKYV
jgi:glycine amidinotransferase/scyllo-inosamine-4-phosphate amidinotransferase 1